MKPNNKVLIEDCLDVRKKGSISVREIEGKNVNPDTYVVAKNLNSKKCWSNDKRCGKTAVEP